MEITIKIFQLIANISIIVLTILVTVLVVKLDGLSTKTSESSSVRSSPSSLTRSQDLKGQKAPITDVNWKESEKTVVLYLSTTCHFCQESTPFYKQLLEAKFKDDFKLVAVFPQDVEEASQYLDAHGLKADQVISRSLSPVGISATPTLLLVDDAGTVSGFWRGKLDETKQSEVLAKLGS
jgi:thiol-disulfide isomerase/thioredoxin